MNCLFFFLSITCVYSFPTNENQEEIQHQLLNPELNSVLEKEVNQDGSQAPITKDIFPDRQGFVTGHRIPLELFSKETIQSLKPVSKNIHNCFLRLEKSLKFSRQNYSWLLPQKNI